MHNVNGFILEQFLVIRVNSRIGGAVLCLCINGSLLDNIAECNHFYVGQLFERGHMLAVCNTAATNDTNSDLFHFQVLHDNRIFCFAAFKNATFIQLYNKQKIPILQAQNRDFSMFV